MKKIKKTFAILLPLLLITCISWAQKPSNEKLNLVKFDLLGPPLAIFTKYPEHRLRASVEYERFLSAKLPISIVVDFEFQARQYTFGRYFAWPPDYLLDVEWWPAITTQFNYSTTLGLRYSSPSVFSDKHSILWFIEPRIAATFQKAKLKPDSISRPFLDANQFGISPRFRTGFWYRLGPKWGFEASIDAQKFKFIGDGHHKWGIVGEINAVFCF